MTSTVRPAPGNRWQARRWNALNADEGFYPIITWPDQIIRLALKQHLNNMERYFLFTFLAHNGANPEWIAEVILAPKTYDNQAVNHVYYLKQHWMTMRVRYYDMQEGKYIQYNGQPGAYTSEGETPEIRDWFNRARARREWEDRMIARMRSDRLEIEAANAIDWSS